MTNLEESGVARLLLAHWDVLAIAEIDEHPESEYLYESAKVLQLLGRGGDTTAVANYLSSAAAGLGAIPNTARDRRAAEAIVNRNIERLTCDTSAIGKPREGTNRAAAFGRDFGSDWCD